MTDGIVSGKITAGVNADHTGVVMIYTLLCMTQRYESYQERMRTL